MGGPLSVTLSDIYMKKMEKDIVVPTKSVLCVDLVMIFTIGEKKNTG